MNLFLLLVPVILNLVQAGMRVNNVYYHSWKLYKSKCKTNPQIVIGTKIINEFDVRSNLLKFHGQVHAYTGTCWLIVYDDGDKECVKVDVLIERIKRTKSFQVEEKKMHHKAALGLVAIATDPTFSEKSHKLHKPVDEIVKHTVVNDDSSIPHQSSHFHNDNMVDHTTIDEDDHTKVNDYSSTHTSYHH